MGYTTELEAGSAMSSYTHDTELSCAMCVNKQKVICNEIPNCAVQETCTTRSNHQCAKCFPGFLLVNGAYDKCGDCPPGKYCDGTTKITDNSGGRRAIFTRWGSRSCPKGTVKLYEGFMAKDYYTHKGSGANYLCMHPQPQWPSGMNGGNQDGALLYGVEYQNTGAVDKNHDKDAACAVRQVKSATGRIPYVQWGRKTCSNDQKTEYYGLIMATHYTQRKSEFACVDWERAFHAKSHNGDQNGGLLYTTELEQGSAMSTYTHDTELSCAVCTSQTKVICVQIPNCAVPVTCSTRANQQCSKCYPGYLLVNGAADKCGSCPKGKYCDGTTSIKDNTGGRHAMFTRWGSRSCPPGMTKMYDGFMAGASHTHHGSGA